MIGGDLAAIIAAKAASRKPIVTSPTRREVGDVEDERYTRSMTVGGESSMQEARCVCCICWFSVTYFTLYACGTQAEALS